jgi:hypothetical protein
MRNIIAIRKSRCYEDIFFAFLRQSAKNRICKINLINKEGLRCFLARWWYHSQHTLIRSDLLCHRYVSIAPARPRIKKNMQEGSSQTMSLFDVYKTHQITYRMTRKCHGGHIVTQAARELN